MATTVKNTTLDFGLVSLEIALKQTSKKKEVKLDRASPAGNPLKRQEVDQETEEVVEPDDVQRGFFDDEGDFCAISEEDLQQVKEVSYEARGGGLEIEEFVRLKDVPLDRITNTYFIVPQSGRSAKGLKYLVKALQKTKKAGVVRFVLKRSSREYLGIVHAENGRLLLSTLVFADDCAAAQEEATTLIEQGGKLERKALGLTCDLINSMTGEGEVLNTATDEQEFEKERLIESARRGQAIKGRPKTKKPTVVADDSLADSLAASIAAEKVKA